MIKKKILLTFFNFKNLINLKPNINYNTYRQSYIYKIYLVCSDWSGNTHTIFIRPMTRNFFDFPDDQDKDRRQRQVELLLTMVTLDKDMHARACTATASDRDRDCDCDCDDWTDEFQTKYCNRWWLSRDKATLCSMQVNLVTFLLCSPVSQLALEAMIAAAPVHTIQHRLIDVRFPDGLCALPCAGRGGGGGGGGGVYCRLGMCCLCCCHLLLFCFLFWFLFWLFLLLLLLLS